MNLFGEYRQASGIIQRPVGVHGRADRSPKPNAPHALNPLRGLLERR
jgi:hypothetical protein